MNLTLKSLLTILCTLVLCTSYIASADGMMVPPSGYQLYETGQQAVIFYDKGVETLAISASFQGNARDFAWIIPTPSKPTVRRGSDELFTSLARYAGATYFRDDRNSAISLLGKSSSQTVGLTIVETKHVDYYDVTVLSATEKDALTAWLADNKFEFPTSAEYMLDSYIDNGWYFVAMRINTDVLSLDGSSSQQRTGHITPVILSFETEHIVYPLKISAVMTYASASEEGQLFVPHTPTWSTSQAGTGVGIGKIGMLSFPAESAFPASGGTLEMYLELNSDWENEPSGTFVLANVVDPYGKDVFQLRRVKSGLQDALEIIGSNPVYSSTWATPDQQSLSWDTATPYHIAVTWSETSNPKLYINGISQTLTKASAGAGSWSLLSTVEGATIFFGQQRSSPSTNAMRGSIKEIMFTSSIKTDQDIKDSYEKLTQEQSMTADANTTFLAHLEKSLVETVSGQEMTYTEYNAIRDYLSSRSSSYYQNIPLVLYVIADHKKTLPDFTTDWANWIKQEDIKKFAVDEQGDPWIKPSGDKYFLTVLSRTLQYSDMNEDLFLRQADNNKRVGHGSTNWNQLTSHIWAVLLVALICFIVVVLLSLFSPIGWLFVIATILQYIPQKRKLHRFGLIMQIVSLVLLVGSALIMLLLVSISHEKIPELVGGIPLSSASAGLQQAVGSVVLLVPIVIVLVAMVIVIILQRKRQRGLSNGR